MSIATSSTLPKDLQTDIVNTYQDLTPQVCERLVPHLLNTEPVSQRNPPPLFLFFKSATLKQVSEQEKVFKENIQNPLFQYLLFFSSYLLSSNKAYEKVKLLLDWGWNPNQIYTPYSQLSEQTIHHTQNLLDIKNPTPLHIVFTPRILELLIEHGADTQAVCQVYSSYQAIWDKGIKEIKSWEEIEVLEPVFESNPNFMQHCGRIYSGKELTLEHQNEFIKEFNRKLAVSQKKFTPYELALYQKEKKKTLFLRDYENQENISTEHQAKIEAIKTHLQSSELAEAKKLLSKEIKNKNPYALAHIDDFKPLIDAEFLFTCVRYNYGNWVQAIIERGWVAKDAVSNIGNKETLLMCATARNHPTIFKYLVAQGYDHEISEIAQMLSRNMDRISNWKTTSPLTPQKVLSLLPTGIIYCLAQKGYHFNNDKVIRLIIDLEKNKLEETVEPVDGRTVKKFKI